MIAAVLALLPVVVNAKIYVNTKAPGVHKEYDSQRGCEVWKSSTGSFLGTVDECEPMTEMDKDNIVYANKEEAQKHGSNQYFVDKDFNQIKKVWDSDRNCYVWKDMFGSYYGRVPDENQLQKWTKQSDFEKWYAKAQKLAHKNYVKYRDSVAKTDGQEDTDEYVIDNRYMDDHVIPLDDEDINAQLNDADAQITEGLNQINEARRQLNDPEVRRMMKEYGYDVDAMLNKAESELLKGRSEVSKGRKNH